MDTQQPAPPETAETTPNSVYSELGGEPLVASRKTLSISWSVYKMQWKSYVGLILLTGVSFLVPVMAFIFTVAGGTVLKGAMPNLAAIAGGASGMMIIIGTLLFIPFILWLSILGFTGVLLPGFADERARLGVVFKFTWRKFWSLIWVSVLYSAIVLAGTILLIVPGIIWGIYYGLSLYTCAFEDKRGMNALRRSKELVKGYVWTMLRRWAFWMYFALLANIIASIPFLNIIGIPLIYFILSPIGYIYWFALYLTIRERKNRGIATDAATGKQKIGTIFLLCGPIILLAILFIVGFAFNQNKLAEPPSVNDNFDQLEPPIFNFDGDGEA